ncbi:hypothetical protein M1O19_00205 [Dehalococcoidia bacterium]|nr:hypothetical protein [Dehalococcoidia bacterium]MCL0096952.1 hypothetical protein [Dehalococcoidia bacterium]
MMDNKQKRNALSRIVDILDDTADWKDQLPPSQRGWVSSLGLYVQRRIVRGRRFVTRRIQAGSKFHAYIDARRTDDIQYGDDFAVFRQYHISEWRIKKYESGDWENLVVATNEIASWLYRVGGLYEDDKDIFDRAVATFKETGKLELPERTDAEIQRSQVETRQLDSPESGYSAGCLGSTLALAILPVVIALYLLLR